MSLVDRYVFREFVPPTLLSLTLYVFLLFMNILFDVAREAIQNEIALGVILKLLYYQLPQLLVVSLPMSILLGSLIGVGRLSADSEVIALQAAGIPFRRLVRPAVILGLAGALVCFYFIAFVAPQGAYAHHLMKREVYLSRYVNAERIGPRVFHESLPGLLLYYDAREPETGGFERVFLYEKDPAGLLERLTVARRGELSFDPESGRVSLYLEDGATHARHLDADPLEDYSVITFGSYQENRDPPAYIQAFTRGLRRNHQEMSLADLSAEIASARQDRNPVVRRLRLGLARTNWHERFALPTAALVFALLGLPMGIVNRRGGKASGFALSLAVVLVYWVGYSVLRDLAETGRLDAFVAVWAPNLLFALLALVLTVARRGRYGSGTRFSLFQKLRDRLRRWQSRRRSRGSTDNDIDSAPLGSFPLLIDRYIASHYVRVFVFVLASVYLVYLLVEFRSLIDDMVDNDIPISVLLRYLLFLIPRMTFTILPVACLVATLVGLGMMARSKEDTAVKAAGVSVFRLLLPVLGLTAFFSLFGYFLQNEILPTTNRVAETLRDQIRGRTPRSRDPRHRWVMGEDYRMYHYTSAAPDRRTLQGLSVHVLDPRTFALTARSYAERVTYNGSAWVFRNGWRRTFRDDGSEVVQFQMEEVGMGITPAFFGNEDQVLLWGVQREPDQMSYGDQRAYIRDLTRRGYDTTALRVALARKITFPLIPLFMVILGFPFSFRVGARGSLFGIGLAIGLIVVYWAALAVFNALGTAALLSPALAAWAPNVFFGGLGLYLTLHVRT
jgi:LPS export ABC transporter permease LptG/LPS export ABC transporter permease LptF